MPPIPGFGIGEKVWDPRIRDPRIAIPSATELRHKLQIIFWLISNLLIYINSLEREKT